LFNYATFLREVSKDYVLAKEYYERAIETKEDDALILNRQVNTKSLLE
jgi:hypothetical protein